MANTNLIARIILRLQDDASRGLNTARQNVSGIGQEIDRVKTLMIGLFSFVAIKEGLEKLVGLSDKFASLTARIKLATSSEQEFNTAQGELFNIAQRTRSALDTVVGLYAKVQLGVKALGGTQKQAFDTTEAVTQAFKISGVSASESAGGIQQLTQALASGVLRGEEFNSIMENGSRVAQALADGLGVPVAALRGMAEAGELTAERVINALLSQKDKLAAEYATLPQTVQGAWQQLENQFLKYIGKSKEAKEATKSIADGIGFVTNHLDTFINVAIKSGEAIAGIFVARKIAGLFAFVQGVVAARIEMAAAEGAVTRVGIAMSGLAAVSRAAWAAIGGPVGAAVLALYGLYAALEKVTGSEEKAAVKAKALADALALSNAEVKKLSGVDIELDFVKTEHNIDVIKDKIKELEAFSFGKLFNLVDLSAQRANLLQTLDVLQKRKDALVAQKNDTIMNFDASALSAAELNAELIDTKARIDEIHQRVDPLKKQLDDGLIGSEAVNDDLASLKAYETKFENLSKQSGDSAFEVYQLRQSLHTIPEAANAMATGIDSALSKAKTSAIQHANELIETAKDSAGKTHKPYDEAAKAITKSFEDSTQAIDIELKHQLDDIKLNAANEEVEIDATAQAFRDAEAEKTTAVENTKTELERVWNETYGTAIELTRKAGGDIEQLERDGAQARIETLQTVVGAYESSISRMIDEEHRLLGEIKKTDEYRLNIQTSIEDKIRASQRKTLSDEAAYADEHNQIYEKLAQADSLRRHGELEAARKTAEEALRLADAHDRVLKDTSDNAVKRAMEAEAKAKASADKINEYAVAGGNADAKRMAAHAKRVGDAADKVAEAHKKVIEAQQKQAEEQAANDRRNIETTTAYQKILESLAATAARLREKQQGAREGVLGDIDGEERKLASVKTALEGVFDEASKKRDVKLKLDAESALKEVGKIDALLAAKDLSLKIKADPEGTAKEVAELNKILKDANLSVPAVAAFEEIKKEELDKKVTQPIADAVSKEQPIKISTDEAIKKAATVGTAVNAAAQPRTLTILTAEAEAEMNRVLAEIAKTKDPQQINVDTAESLSKVSAVTQQIASIPKNTITRLDADGNPISTTIIKTKDELEGLSRQNTITRLDADGRPLSTKVIGAKEELDGLKNTAPIVIDADVEKARAKTDALKVELIEKYQGMIAELSKKFDSMKAVSPDVDTEKAKGQIEEFSAKADDLLKAVDLGLNTTTASTELDRLKADVDAKLSAPTEAIHKVNPDFAAVFNDINAIKQNTSSTHTVYVNKVENNATGGLIQHLATGGRVAAQTFRRVVGAIKGPGTGTSDDVPVMASNGEFVVKTDAVQHYGVNFMNALNNKQLPVAPGYAIGGAIGETGASSGVSNASPAPAGETMTLVFKFDNKSIPGQFAPGNARALAVELRRLASVC